MRSFEVPHDDVGICSVGMSRFKEPRMSLLLFIIGTCTCTIINHLTSIYQYALTSSASHEVDCGAWYHLNLFLNWSYSEVRRLNQSDIQARQCRDLIRSMICDIALWSSASIENVATKPFKPFTREMVLCHLCPQQNLHLSISGDTCSMNGYITLQCRVPNLESAREQGHWV
jgi:hypothetical protein